MWRGDRRRKWIASICKCRMHNRDIYRKYFFLLYTVQYSYKYVGCIFLSILRATYKCLFPYKYVILVLTLGNSREPKKLSLRHRKGASRGDLRQLYKPCTSDIKYLALSKWRGKNRKICLSWRVSPPRTIPRSRCSRMRYKPLINDHSRKNSLVIVVLLMARNCTL